MWRNKKGLWSRVTSGFMAFALTAVSVINPMTIVHSYATENWANLSYQNVEKNDVELYILSENESFAAGEEVSFKLYVQNNTEDVLSGGLLAFADSEDIFEDAKFTFDEDSDVEEGPQFNEKGNITNITINPGEEFEAELTGFIDEDMKLTSRETVNFIFKAKDSTENEVTKLVKYDFNTGFATFLPIEFANGSEFAPEEDGTMTFRIALNQEDSFIEVETDSKEKLASDSDADLASDSDAKLASDSDADLASDSNSKTSEDSELYEFVQDLKQVKYALKTYGVQFEEVQLTDAQAIQTMNGMLEVEATVGFRVAKGAEVGNHFGTVAAEVKVGKRTYKVSQAFEYEVEEGAPQLTEEEMYQVQSVLDMIAQLPSMEEYWVATDRFFYDEEGNELAEEDIDLEGLDAYIRELALIVIPAFDAYWALNDAQRALIPVEDVEKLEFIYGLCEGVTLDIPIIEDYSVTDKYYTGIRQNPGALILNQGANEIIAINEPIASEYGANGLVLGLKPADSTHFFTTDDSIVPAILEPASQTTGGYTTQPNTNDNQLCLSGGISRYSGVCDGATVVVGKIGTNGIINDLNRQNEFGVLYRNVGTYNGDKIDLKVTVKDYAVQKDDRFKYDSNNINDAVIGLYTNNGKPGVDVFNVAWVQLEYEFYKHETIKVNGKILDETSAKKVAVKGNTTYYDIDAGQSVYVDSTCKRIHVTNVNGDYYNTCLLFIGRLSGDTSGWGVYEADNSSYSGYESDDKTYCAFTEAFDVSDQESMIRTFNFRRRTASGLDTGRYPQYGGDYINAEGKIYNSGLPVIREGSLYIKKEVSSGTSVDKSKDYNFRLELADTSINGKFGDLTFENGVAEFTLKHGKGVQVTDLKLGANDELRYTVTELNPDGYTVKVNGVNGHSYTGTITSNIYVQNNQIPTVTFDNARSVTSIDISKVVVGNQSDLSKQFNFGIAVKVDNNTYTDYTIMKGSTNFGSAPTFTLANGESVTVNNVPVGAKVEITETNEDYAASIKVNGSSVNDENTASNQAKASLTAGVNKSTVEFTNERVLTSINISKAVTGSQNDLKKQFNFGISVKVNNTLYTGYTIMKGSTNLGSATTFTLANSESVTVNNVPVGATVEITEANGNFEASINVTGAQSVNNVNTQGKTSFVTTVNPTTVAYTNKRVYTTVDITKTVTGNLGDRNKVFKFYITVTENGEAYTDYNLTSGGSAVSVNKATGEFTLKHGQTVTVNNVPVNATIVIKENNEDYKVKQIKVNDVVKTDEDGSSDTSAKVTITTTANKSTVVFTNDKEATIDTGILLDSAPYILTLGIALGGMAMYVINKRKKEDDLD